MKHATCNKILSLKEGEGGGGSSGQEENEWEERAFKM